MTSISDRIIQAMTEEAQEINGRIATASEDIDPGDRLIREVSRSVGEVHDHILNSISSLRNTLDLIERAIQAKRKSHEEQLSDYVSFSKKAILAIADVDGQIRQMGEIIMDMPKTRPVAEPEVKALIGQ